MRKLPSAIITAKNKMNSPDAWVLLAELTLVNPDDSEDTTTIRVARNQEDVTLDGNVYTAFPFQIEPSAENQSGELPSVRLMISNVTRVLQPDIEAYSGGVGSTVKLFAVSMSNLEESYAGLELEYEIIGCESSAEWITLVLGAPNPLRQRFPLYKYAPSHCQWAFKSCECGYDGVDFTECNKTHADCKERGQQERFGGFLGLRSGSIRVV